ncbi:uncharacterized protein [Aegilops tauschii subsp. strangulata]|uniref:Uncharacterized protein n=2 Tax=Aegilops tauschii subsp. strangulata TaxID=200361 RepID=A0A453FIJ6_AEGTS|nr:uncharacterized protein LOC109752936 [Aegilops tauschii subsp. strangulata]XP_044353447.1 uncharacterized protein LOC123074753 [Triticum aestivum]
MGATEPSSAPPHRPVSMSSCMPSPSWSPPGPGGRHRAAVVVRRLQVAARDAIPGVGWCGHRAWRKLLRRLAQETRCICSSPAPPSRPSTFGYDAVSYAKNFDDGRSHAPHALPCAAAADKQARR